MAVAAVLPIIRSQFSRIKICSEHDKVYKDECVFSFDTPYSDNGLYVNLSTLQGFGADYLAWDIAHGGVLYLHEKWLQVPKSPPASESDGNIAVTKLAIGVEGGFSNAPLFDTIKEHYLVVIGQSGERIIVPLPCSEIPEYVTNVINSIIAHGGMRPKMEHNTWSADNEIFESKYAMNLVQLNTGKKISQDPSTWKCELSGETDNLWLNLSTGYIGGSRRNWDGSGGSGAALKHFEETGCQYPLCVKLGTITPHSADVWSYAKDEATLVKDPLLAEHLSHWGIDSMKLTKTAQSISEAEVALNMSYDWSKLMEGGDLVESVHGPGLVGIQNIGSSCYMNSVMQTMLHVPEIQQRYFSQRPAILASAPSDPTSDFGTQFSKLADALLTDKYLPPEDTGMQCQDSDSHPVAAQSLEKFAIGPRMLKAIVAQNNAEFLSGRQQDASEYFMILLQALSRSERTLLPRIGDQGPPTASLFEFETESRYQCCETGQVKYVSGKQCLQNCLELRIPLDEAVNLAEVECLQEAKKARLESDDASAVAGTNVEDVKLHIPLSSCLHTMFGAETVQLTNPTVGRLTEAVKTIRMRSFPRYLMVKLARYYVGPSWVQVKVDARVPMPENLDLSSYLAHGLQPDEVAMPEIAASTSSAVSQPTVAAVPAKQEIDEDVLAQLVSMGFAENGCRKAAMTTHDIEEAMNWVLVHMEDPDFNDPPVINAGIAAIEVAVAPATLSPAIQEAIGLITSMGYTEEQALAALKATDNNIERALDWIFSHSDDIDAAVATVNSTAAPATPSGAPCSAIEFSTNGKYTLMAVISHLGSNTACGHYVCHVKQPDGQWVLFNDDKVGKSNAVKALEYGFMYLYARDDGPKSF